MDFELTDEQRLLRESVERLMTDRYDFAARKRFAQEPGGFGTEPWRQYADLGLLGLPFAEHDGGLGGGPVETMIVMEAFGRALALEPYLATIVLGPHVQQLPEHLREPFMDDVMAELGEPVVVDYVRLNIDALA